MCLCPSVDGRNHVLSDSEKKETDTSRSLPLVHPLVAGGNTVHQQPLWPAQMNLVIVGPLPTTPVDIVPNRSPRYIFQTNHLTCVFFRRPPHPLYATTTDLTTGRTQPLAWAWTPKLPQPALKWVVQRSVTRIFGRVRSTHWVEGDGHVTHWVEGFGCTLPGPCLDFDGARHLVMYPHGGTLVQQNYIM